jgi:hypothetical protein
VPEPSSRAGCVLAAARDGYLVGKAEDGLGKAFEPAAAREKLDDFLASARRGGLVATEVCWTECRQQTVCPSLELT